MTIRMATGVTMSRSPLAQVGIEYVQERTNFIAGRLLPGVRSDQKGATRLVWSPHTGMHAPEADWPADGDPNDMPAAELLEKVFLTRRRGLRRKWDTHNQADIETEYDIDGDMENAALLMMALLLGHEIRVANLCFNTATFAPVAGSFAGKTFHSAGPAINNDPNADADKLVSDGHQFVSQSCGVVPNTVAVAEKTYYALGRNAQIADKVKLTVPETARFSRLASGEVILSEAALAAYFQVDQFLVGRARVASKNQGDAFEATPVWDDDYLLFARVENGENLKLSPRLGGTWYWDRFSGPDGEPHLNPPFIVEETAKRGLLGFHFTDEQVWNPQMGWLFTGIDAAAPG